MNYSWISLYMWGSFGPVSTSGYCAGIFLALTIILLFAFYGNGSTEGAPTFWTSFKKWTKRILTLTSFSLFLLFACVPGNRELKYKWPGDKLTVTQPTMGAVDIDSFERWRELAIADDTIGTVRMWLKGELKMIPSETTCVLVEKRATKALVFLPDGSELWVNSAFLQ